MIQTLAELLPRLSELGHREALRYFNGFRSWKVSYTELLERSGGCAFYFDREGIRKGDRILIWGENRPEWVFAFWGAVARGIQIVTADLNSSVTFVKRIQCETEPKLIVHGDDVDSSCLKGPRLSFADIQDLDSLQLDPVTVNADDIVEIVYTSGTTSQPKGVIHRHRNLCANLRPFVDEFRRFRFLATPFQPVRLLNLLPLSHMFGQSMGLFIPLLLEGSSVFARGLSPPAIMETLSREKISVLVAVPRIVEQLRRYVTRTFGPADQILKTKRLLSIPERWMRHRRFHASAGWKFWAIVVGGAPLSEDVERFWSSLGILVVQGYGLTEASPIVSLNHPFRAKSGSIGKPIKGQQVKIASDGEILIRGENVISQYFGSTHSDKPFTKDGWLHTGDLGEYDEKGNLIFRGRKTDLIVTSEGLNVYPRDVEQVLEQLPGISASVVVGILRDGEEQIHAVLLSSPGTAVDLQDTIQKANRILEPHQRIRGWTKWPHSDFPRTPSTLKVDRKKIKESILSEDSGTERRISPAGNEPPEWLEFLLKSPGEADLKSHLELDLGLTSLDRIELLSRLQQHHSTQLDEATFSKFSTIGDISSWLERSRAQFKTEKPAPESIEPRHNTTPRWTRWFPVRALRDAMQICVVIPLFRRYIQFQSTGIENLEKVSPPVIFAANHTSNLDTIALLAALPESWRKRLAPSIRQEYFAAHFGHRHFGLTARLRSSLEYYLACTVFNTFPIPQKVGGIQKTLRYAGELVEAGYCPLLFPEGGRSEDGTIRPFLPGIGIMAIQLQVPVVPVKISGLFEVLSQHDRWPKAGRCVVRIGYPLKFRSEVDPELVARLVEKAVRELGSNDSKSRC